MHQRSIIHLNVADFAAAVEQAVDSGLRTRPLIIAPEGAPRATVYDMSDEAYRNGVRKGMAVRRALRYCPGARVLPPHPSRYERAMEDLLRHTLPYSPLIEMADHNGHLFIDATGTGRLFGPPQDLAWRIRRAVQNDMGLNPIWAVAPNKLVAKVATRMVKPSGEYIVKPGDEASFLNPLAVHLIPGIDGGELKRLHEFNLTRAGHVTRLSLAQLEVVFGERGRSLHDAVRGIDPSPVSPPGAKKPSVTAEHTFGNDTNDVARVESALYGLIEQAGAKLRKMKLAAGRVRVLIDYSDGKRNTRTAAVKPVTSNDFNLFSIAGPVLMRAWNRRVRIRNLRVLFDRLNRRPAQMELFLEHPKPKESRSTLIEALDSIRSRYGAGSVLIGKTLTALRS